MSLDRDFGKNFDSAETSVHNPWVSEVAAPIEQDLRLFEFPEDVEAALRNAEELRAQAEDRSGIITNPIIAARKELSDLPEFDILSRTKGGFYDYYKAGDASVADVMRYTLGAATAKPEVMEYVGFYWSATFGTEKPLFPSSTDNERNANVSAAREWFSNNQEVMANALKDPLYELASKFVSSHSRALGEFDLVCGVGIRQALGNLKALPFDNDTTEQIKTSLMARIQEERSELLEQCVQSEVDSVKEEIDKCKDGILRSNPLEYDYKLDDLQRRLVHDEVRSRINEADAAAAIESIEKWRKFIAGAFGSVENTSTVDILGEKSLRAKPPISIKEIDERMYSGIITEAEKGQYLALREKIVQYENIVREYSPLGMDDGGDFSEHRQAILDDEGFKRRFSQEIRFAVDPVILARELAKGGDFVFDELTSRAFHVLASNDKDFIQKLGLTSEANKMKGILQRGRNSRKFGDLDIVDSLLRDEFTEEARRSLMLLGARSIYDNIASCTDIYGRNGKISEDKIVDMTDLIMDRLDLAGVEHEISEDDFIEAAINTCNNKLK